MDYPQRRYKITIEIDAYSADELWSTLVMCLNEVRQKRNCASLGGDFKNTNYNAQYQEYPNKTEAQWLREREKFVPYHMAKMMWEHEYKLKQNEKSESV